MGGLSRGLSRLFQAGSKRIGNAIDNFWLDAEAKKAIEDEVISKFKPQIDRFTTSASRRATRLTELDKKLTESKKALQDAQKAWQDKYNTALADAKNQRQTEISDYDTKLQGYQDTLANARAGRQGIADQLYDSEANFDPYKTIYTDVNTGEKYIRNRFTGKYDNITRVYNSRNSTSKDIQKLTRLTQGFEDRLFDKKSGNLINPFDKQVRKTYKGQNNFDDYLSMRERQNAALIRDFRDADNQVKKAKTDLTTWQSNTRPQAWDDNPNSNDLKQFKNNFTGNNGKLPSEYSFNGQTYSKEADLDAAYQKALSAEQTRKDLYSRVASGYVSKRDKEIAQRIQDAKDIKKAKLALGAGAGAGALFAGAAAMYGGDDTDNTDNIDNTNNTDNTDNTTYGEPDPDLNTENTPEGKAALIGKSLVDTDFDPDIADALANAAYDQGVKDGNAVRSSDIAAATGGHTIDDRLFELIKAMKDPYKADAVANYIYSRHGDDPEVQRLGWRGWLNKYYGDSLRSKMNIDPSGYKGMHISGGL